MQRDIKYNYVITKGYQYGEKSFRQSVYMDIQNEIFWSENWYIEGNNAWFISGEDQVLCLYEMQSKKCVPVSRLPRNNESIWRAYSGCIKIDEDIICIPNKGENILIYSNSDLEWRKLKINNIAVGEIIGFQYKVVDSCLYIFSKGLNKLILLDLYEKRISSYVELLIDENDRIEFGTFTDDSFYVVSSAYFSIYEYQIKNKKIVRYNLPRVEDKLSTLCYANKKFVLSGYKKCIYIWEKGSKKLRKIEHFPPQFGEYNFDLSNEKIIDYEIESFKERTFYNSVKVNKYIWFVPFQTSKILYFDIESNELNAFEIVDEIETINSLKKNGMRHRYLFCYIREDRFLALYSLANKHLIEIDTKNMSYHLLEFHYVGNYLNMIDRNICMEENRIDCAMYTAAIKSGSVSANDVQKDINIGSQICKEVIGE